MKQREQPTGYHIDCCFGDAADPEAVATVNAKFGPCIALPEAKQNWRAGIDTVKTFLKLRQVGELDEYGTPRTEPKLFVDHSCLDVIREFNNYRTVATVTSATRESGAASAAQKQDDHALDALRYGLVHLYELGARGHLAEVYSGEMTLDEGIHADEGVFTMSQSF